MSPLSQVGGTGVNLDSHFQIARDDNNLSKGYGFVSFADFESSDAAITNMNGQYLMNKQVSVQYAYKKDGKGERHGDEAERMLASQARKHNVKPPTQQAPQAPRPGPAGVGASATPPVMPNGDTSRPMGMVPPPTSDFGMTTPYSNDPSNRNAPPPGLPARPPPSQAGYGGPSSFTTGFASSPFSHPGSVPPQLPPGFQPQEYGSNR